MLVHLIIIILNKYLIELHSLLFKMDFKKLIKNKIKILLKLKNIRKKNLKTVVEIKGNDQI